MTDSWSGKRSGVLQSGVVQTLGQYDMKGVRNIEIYTLSSQVQAPLG
jgi:hypothetical protein